VGCGARSAGNDARLPDGAIHLLPALPGQWGRGSISGLRARGGYIIESLQWEQGRIVELTVRSTLGGNARIRAANELVGAGGMKLQKANGPNSNAFYQLDQTPEPLISSKADLNSADVAKIYEYDFATKAGETYTVTGKKQI
jgi:alpha-L-fucosidase 2